jgi:hypothetical protein
MGTKDILLAVGLVITPASMVNGTIFYTACDNEQLAANCRDASPDQRHTHQRKPSEPILGQRAAFVTSAQHFNSRDWGKFGLGSAKSAVFELV